MKIVRPVGIRVFDHHGCVYPQTLAPIPGATKFLLTAILGVTITHQFLGIPMGLAPGQALLTRPWTMLTAGFYLDGYLNIILGPILVALLSLRLAKTQSARQMFIPIVIAIAASNAVFYLVYTLKLSFVSEPIPYRALASGPSAIIAALALSLLQAAPDATLQVFGDVVFKAAYLPICVLLLAVFDGLGAQTCAPILLSSSGILSTYWYIRFFKVVDGRRGDRSIAMSFPALFPAFLHTPMEWLSTGTFRMACKVDRWSLLHGSLADEENRLPSRRFSSQEMERRRLMALNILNEKMNRKKEEMAALQGETRSKEENATKHVPQGEGDPISAQENGRPLILAQMA